MRRASPYSAAPRRGRGESSRGAGGRFCAGPPSRVPGPSTPCSLPSSPFLYSGDTLQPKSRAHALAPPESALLAAAIPAPGHPPRPPPSAPGEASLTRGVNAQTCPQSLPNPQTQPQVLTAPGGCAELRGWVSVHPSPQIPARLPPRRAALLRSWDAGLPRKTYGRYPAGSQVRGSLPRILAQLACGTFLDQLVKTLRASVS